MAVAWSKRSPRVVALGVVLVLVATGSWYLVDRFTGSADSRDPQPRGPVTAKAGAAITTDVTPDAPFEIVVPDVVVIRGTFGSVTEAGRITATPMTSTGDMGAPGLTVAGVGVDVDIEGTELTRALEVTFLDVDLSDVEDGVDHGVLHRADDGTTDVKFGKVVGGDKLQIMTKEFSLNLPIDIDLGKWFSDRFDSLADGLAGRTDPDPCRDDAPSWAVLTSTTDLLHSCSVSNPDDSGVERAEAQLKANRRVWMSVSTPPGAAYVWVKDVPDPVRSAAAALNGTTAARYVLLPPEGTMTAGFYRPAQALDYEFTADTQGVPRMVSLVSVILGEFGLSGKSLLAASFLLVGSCLDEIPRSGSMLGDRDSVFQLFKCVAGRGAGELEDHDTAFAAAMDLFGERGYAESAASGVKTVSGSLRILGRVLAVLGFVSLLRDAVNNVIDDLIGVLAPESSKVTFRLSAAPAPTTPPTSAGTPSSAPTTATTPPTTAAPPTTPPPTAPSTPSPAPAAATLVVQNQVTNGASQMREDRTPIYLSTAARTYCKANGCAIAGTDMWSGSTLTASCWARGEVTTNGDNGSSLDDANPGLWTSDLYYRAANSAGVTGLINEVWIAAGNRGGMGLPAC